MPRRRSDDNSSCCASRQYTRRKESSTTWGGCSLWTGRVCMKPQPTEGRRSELFHTHAHACSSSVKWRCLYSSCARSSLPSRLMNKCDITLPSLVYFLFFLLIPSVLCLCVVRIICLTFSSSFTLPKRVYFSFSLPMIDVPQIQGR